MLEDSATSVYLRTFGPATIIALATIVAAWITARSNKQGANQNEGTRAKDKVGVVASIVAAGFTVTAVVMLYVLASGQISALAQLSNIENSAPSRRTLADFPESPTNIGRNLEVLDEDAEAILDSAGPKDWKSGGRTWNIGDVVYVDQSEWVEEVFPRGEREELAYSDRCLLEPKGKLTIRGFSSKRRSALIEYTAPGPNGGTPCNTGTYFFYPLPR